MSHLSALSNAQKVQIRNAFLLIDSDSKDSKITTSDLVNVHKTLGVPVPSDKELKEMLGGDESVNFTQFSQIMAEEFSKVDDRTTISNAIKVFAKDPSQTPVQIDADKLKEACCSVQLGEIGSGDHRLSRSAFDKLTKGFVSEQMDGSKVFMAEKWLDAYIE
ncbi:hypothetical protein FT663_04075 [Candidozyma haemuli var. vulneris]|uniref:EF-hand domain-containing protein n=1 Tax=Candidozyma haemuli TaxID=45357 RepID=A0A2V1AVR9_9ASCO|nr:hypothetical protein CXQ85_004589 [[Candida] haemuloni]KAF3988319.1 hypothetical protein FT663_04075 [[Candida] haemuloni var. vulneris]KAF3988401.1 hypothetical protein FT662_03434 [[Candida] haemuloni var. vulneris]PVH21925.1 hypothetical protein CXQ85_004589 [[Candida] haemuloni]